MEVRGSMSWRWRANRDLWFKDYGSITFSYVDIVFIPSFLLQITLVLRDNADTQGLFPHQTTNTAPLSGEPKRNFWASTSPPFVWRIKRTQFHFQQKLKRKIMKRANLLFSVSLNILLHPGKRKQWAPLILGPQGPYKGHSPAIKWACLPPLVEQVCNGTGSYSWRSSAVHKKKRKKTPQCFKEPTVFTPGFSQRRQFLALRLWRFGERRFEKPLAMFLPASIGLLRTVCSLRTGTNASHTFLLFISS